jgi:mono/diheme cytochrome c family protein
VRLRKLARPILIAAVGCGALGVLAAVAYIESGIYNVAASKPHTRFTFWVTHETMVRSVRRHAASITPPRKFSAQEVAAGFCAYESHCVACHGAAGVARQQWTGGMEPAPPYLLDINERFTRAQLFWIVKNGIKMTGMPSWKNEMPDGEIWTVVAWLEASAKLPPQTYSLWRAQRRCAGPAVR